MIIRVVKEKAIVIAVRTFFSDAIGLEHEIWEWLCQVNDETPESPYAIWEQVASLSYFELFEVVEALRTDIVYSFRASNNR